jgi:DNA polymerase III epsilon subunit-like protein
MRSDVMVDLETLGTVAGCVVLSIGAVGFDMDGLDETGFHLTVNRESCEEAMLFVDPDTEAWWGRQSPVAQEILARSR